MLLLKTLLVYKLIELRLCNAFPHYTIDYREYFP